MQRKLITPKAPPTRHYRDYFGTLVFDEKRYKRDCAKWKLLNNLIRMINEDRIREGM